jgi:hypothetical protein
MLPVSKDTLLRVVRREVSNTDIVHKFTDRYVDFLANKAGRGTIKRSSGLQRKEIGCRTEPSFSPLQWPFLGSRAYPPRLSSYEAASVPEKYMPAAFAQVMFG